MTNIDADERPCLVCALCNTYVATAKLGAPESGVTAAFAAASVIHNRMFHSNTPVEDVQFIYGLRKMS